MVVNDPVLLVGGSGVVGSEAARILRRLEPGLPIAIGGRDVGRADAVAAQVGGARAVRVDLDRADLGLAGDAFSAVVMFVKDDTLNSLRFAQARHVPYVGISSGMFEIAPEVALHVHDPASAPILLNSHWLAGTATLPALYFAREFRTVESVAIAAVLDEQDMGGPAAYADYERYTTASPNALILHDGRWRWVGDEGRERRVKTVDGTEVLARAYGLLDVASLAAATGARSVRFDLTVGETASRRRGEAFSTEIVIEIEGAHADGTTRLVRHEIVHPAGQAPLTALGVGVSIQRLLGLVGGAPVAPGLYFPDVIIDPEAMLRRMTELGAQVRRVQAGEEA